MREMTRRLDADPDLRASYQAAHRAYAERRREVALTDGIDPLPEGTQTAGGMPDRVKCLHAVIAHELAEPGLNPFGREAILAIGQWWTVGPCVDTAGRAG